MNSTQLIKLSDRVKKATDAFYGEAAEAINDILLKKGIWRKNEYTIDLTKAHFNVYLKVFACPEDEEGQSPLKISSNGDPTDVCFTGEWGDCDLDDLQRDSVVDIVRWLEQYVPTAAPQHD